MAVFGLQSNRLKLRMAAIVRLGSRIHLSLSARLQIRKNDQKYRPGPRHLLTEGLEKPAASRRRIGEKEKMTYASLRSVPKAFDQHKRLIVVQVAAVLAVILLLFSKPALAEGSDGHEIVETIGFVMVLTCFLGRLWSILFVGGRKNDELIVSGPFSMMQNPLYFFSTVGAVGIGLMFGSALAAAMLGLASYVVFRFTARKEAAFLSSKFGSVYTAYAERTPRFWPNPLLYHDEEQWLFSTKALKSTFRDGLYFLALFPVIEAVEYFRVSGTLPTLFTVY